MSFGAAGRARRAQLRGAGECDRIALCAQSARRRLQHQHRAAGGAQRVPLDGKAMTAANGIDHAPGAAQTALHRCTAHVAAAFAMLTRRPRLHGRNPWPLAPQQLAIAAGLAVVIFLLVMFLIDAAAINGVGHLPRWIVWFFAQIPAFGKSGWFLWPLGILFLGLAALPSLPRLPQLVLAATMLREGFLLVAIGAA